MYHYPEVIGSIWRHSYPLLQAGGRNDFHMVHKKCLRGKEKKKKKDSRGGEKTKLSQQQTRSLSVFWLCFILSSSFSSQTSSEKLQHSAACGCLDWTQTAISDLRAHFRSDMQSICAQPPTFARHVYMHVLTRSSSVFTADAASLLKRNAGGHAVTADASSESYTPWNIQIQSKDCKSNL